MPECFTEQCFSSNNFTGQHLSLKLRSVTKSDANSKAQNLLSTPYTQNGGWIHSSETDAKVHARNRAVVSTVVVTDQKVCL